jgi:hypothetical protein
MYTTLFLCSGDQDSVIPLTGSRSLVHNLAKQIGLKTTVPYRVWFTGTQVFLFKEGILFINHAMRKQQG